MSPKSLPSRDPMAHPMQRIGLSWRIALTALVVIAILVPAVHSQKQPLPGPSSPCYVISEVRTFTTRSEGVALSQAERLDLAAEVGTFRFYEVDTSTHGYQEDPCNPAERPRPHLVDSASLTAARAWVEHCRDSRDPVSSSYRYRAECSLSASYQMVPKPSNSSGMMQGHYTPRVLFYMNPTGLISHDGIYHLHDVFVVTQELTVSSYINGLASSGYMLVQTIVLDSGMHIRCLEVNLYTGYS